MARHGTPAPSAPVDPKPGRNPGYAEERPGDRRDAHRPAEPSRPSPDEPGIGHDADATPAPGEAPTR